MSTRSLNIDKHGSRDLVPKGKVLAEPRETPPDLLMLAAALLEHHGAASSECRACAGRLRALVRQLAAAQRAGDAFGGR